MICWKKKIKQDNFDIEAMQIGACNESEQSDQLRRHVQKADPMRIGKKPSLF